MFLGLLFYVLDAVRLIKNLIKRLDPSNEWEKPSFLGPNEPKLLCSTYTRLKNLQIIADHTEDLKNLIYYPFLVLFLFILARYNVFDNWHFSSHQIAMIIICFIAAGSNLRLRGTALKFKTDSLEYLQEELRKIRISSLTHDQKNPKIACIEHVIKEVKNNQKGVFCPLRETPILKAILIPFGGIGSLALLEMLVRW